MDGSHNCIKILMDNKKDLINYLVIEKGTRKAMKINEKYSSKIFQKKLIIE